MLLAEHAARCRETAQSMRRGWTADQLADLEGRLVEMGMATWQDWRHRYLEVTGEVAMMPEQRQKAFFADHPEAVLFRLAAIQFLLDAGDLLQSADRLMSRVRRPHEQLVGEAGDEAFRILSAPSSFYVDHHKPADPADPLERAMSALLDRA